MQLNNLNIAVLGAGRSGRAAARLAMKHGARVCVFDASSSIDGWPEDIPLHTAATEEDGRAFHADLVVISPGIETDSPFVKSFGREGVETIGEMELACRFYHGRIIAITGTNGKTTTTSVWAHLRNCSMVRISTGRPQSGKNCFGMLLPNRVPLPPATIIA